MKEAINKAKQNQLLSYLLLQYHLCPLAQQWRTLPFSVITYDCLFSGQGNAAVHQAVLRCCLGCIKTLLCSHYRCDVVMYVPHHIHRCLDLNASPRHIGPHPLYTRSSMTHVNARCEWGFRCTSSWPAEIFDHIIEIHISIHVIFRGSKGDVWGAMLILVNEGIHYIFPSNKQSNQCLLLDLFHLFRLKHLFGRLVFHS